MLPVPTLQSPLAGITRRMLPATTPTPRPASPALPQNWKTDWSYEVAEMAPGLTALQPYFVQCRGNAESALAAQEFMGLWAIRNEHKDRWVSGAGARLTIQGQTASAGTEYGGGISIGAGQDGWLMPNANILGRVMTGESDTPSKLVLSIADVNWEALRGDAGQYAYEVSIHDDATYGDANFPRHTIVLRVANTGKLPMKGVYFLAVLQGGSGRTVDVLTQGIPPSSGIALMDRQGGNPRRRNRGVLRTQVSFVEWSMCWRSAKGWLPAALLAEF